MKYNLGTFFSFTTVLIAIYSVDHANKYPVGNTTIWWCIFAIIILGFIAAKSKYYHSSSTSSLIILFTYLAWNVICIIRGVFVAENYWEWKNLTTVSFYLLWPLSIFISTHPSMVQKVMNTWVKYMLPAFLLYLIVMKFREGLGYYLVPVSFFLLFLPILTKKWKVIILVLLAIVLIGAPNARSNVIRFSVSFILGLLFYFEDLISTRLINLGRWVLLLIPILLFTLGATGKFNVFNMDEYIKESITTTVVTNGVAQEESLTTDTRTFLYEEVLNSAFKYNYVWLGRTPARGNESVSFGDYAIDVLKTGKLERPWNEVAVLNIFTWTGVVGLVLYFLVFFQASYLAVNKSSNRAMKIIGLFVAFRWTYAWVEEFTRFDLTNFFLWIMIGMCFSNFFRGMTDAQIKQWILGIFDKKYREIG